MTSLFAPTLADEYAWNIRFGSYCWDVSGLLLSRYRWLQTYVETWIARDPLSFSSGDVSPYRYALSNPTTLNDTFGLAACGGKTCVVCNVSAYYVGNIATFDALADNSPFSKLAEKLLIGMQRPTIGIKYEEMTRAGLQETLNEAVAGGPPAGVAKGVSLLFYIVFDICESKPGDCRIFLDETGSALQTGLDLIDASENWGDITGGDDVLVAKSKSKMIGPNGVGCCKMLIYADTPGSIAILKVKPKSFKQRVTQKIEIKDRSGEVVRTFKHQVIFGSTSTGVASVDPPEWKKD